MKVPEATCLLSEAIAAKPRVLIVTRIIETSHSPCKGIMDLVIHEEFLHCHAVKKKIGVGIFFGDAVHPFADFLFFFFFLLLGICAGKQAKNKGYEYD